VKAIEYYLKDELKSLRGFPNSALEFVHFCLTSEDVNNLSYALMIREALQLEYVPAAKKLLGTLGSMARRWRKIPMLAMTHGQPASPTTVGKELLVFVKRLERQLDQIRAVSIRGKFGGATGNWNAQLVAYPKVNWVQFSQRFITSLKLEPNLVTTQIEAHDWNAELFDAMRRFNTVMLDLSRDMWLYISRGAFKQKLVAGEVGSSTMPHKVNPIQFENAEGNIELANALLGRLAEKLPTSRLQRDLTDSTVQRSMGTAFGYTLLAFQSLLQGLDKVELNRLQLKKELDENWEVLAEPIQQVMRRYGVSGAYEKLKALTRGKKLGPKELAEFVEGLKIPQEAKEQLKKLTPWGYIGLADKLV
ncbi:MAG: adenylosuccinate lyase, partial [bacterium]|nr:adenylosuccinate lyase [bacterium]